MIQIMQSTDNKGIYVRLIVGYPLKQDTRIDFYHACSNDTESLLLRQHLDRTLESMMKKMRQVSYRRGWRHAKSKKMKKETFFASCAEVTAWEQEDAGRP